MPKTTVRNIRTTASVLAASAARTLPCPITNPNGADRPPHGTCQSTPSYLCHQPFRLPQTHLQKRKALHNGLDLKANYEPTYAMMHGRGHQGRQDKRSGLYVTPPSRRLHRQLLPPLPNSRHQRHPRPSGIIIALTGNSGRSTGPHLHLTLKDTKRTSHRPVHSSQSYQASTLIERLVFCRSHHPFRIAIMS